MLRLRNGIEKGLRHPLYGPLLLVLLALLLAFVVFHAVEHGAFGDILVCVALAAFGLSLITFRRSTPLISRHTRLAAERAPPSFWVAAHRVAPACAPALSSPLRR